MKKFNLNKIAVLLIALVVITGCVKDDEFEVPTGISGITEYPVSGAEFNPISSVLGNFTSGSGDAVTYEESGVGVSDKYTEGYVVSSDEGGNFFKQIVIQDRAENPTGAIVIQVDKNPMFTQYEFGRKVFIKLNGLSVGLNNGVIQLGRLEGNEINRIPNTQVSEYIFRAAEVGTIIAKEVSVSDFSDALESQYIKLVDMQFNRSLMGQSFASETNDSFDGERLLENCATGGSVILSTSTFSDFKGLQLPINRGSIEGILTRDFFDDFYTIYINTPEGINFDNPDRCDPDFLECTGPSGGGTVIFEEDFEGFSDYATEGWDNINIDGTSTDWFISGFGGNNYSRISAFSSNNTDANVWLVTPALDMDTTTGEEISFDVQASYDNGTNLSVYVSTDYAGDPTTATWSLLDATIPTGPSGTFGNFETVGPINVSCVEGTAVFGFFYEGSDPSASTRYHLDNLEVTGN
ncbi:DUF5689 domain-containing protein [Lacinutrix jangbogonensis]|uniref:DUF5689 domain-containing protein n=1 Tax=Lacinutrix jangbogonensis TaxID=1469557 RepID=UPI00053DDA99|nr:DUF5689 domain-containing protein [Lacinutrix jangbogonensis]